MTSAVPDPADHAASVAPAARDAASASAASGASAAPVAELITYFDDATGERTGLTASELGGWAAATAALLTAECGLTPGDRVAVLLPPHWQTAAVLLGAWSAGLEVSFRGWATAGLPAADDSPSSGGAARGAFTAAGDSLGGAATGPFPAAGDSLGATFVEARRVGSWLDDVPAGRHQFVLGLGAAEPPPGGYRDYLSAVRPHLGAARPSTPVGAHDLAAAGVTFGEYEAVARGAAASQGITRGDRVLIEASRTEQPVLWLLGPLAAGASIVLCADLDRSRLAERVAAERVTKVFA
ncbi:TIGR03089 family protein [Actinoplanes sp. CA-030573]|uniref:TIGR03089 family protein n=1 Tax=Actinoplanes sp. CA-030573 TaxID=3239898 RepID=UPI003D8E3055